MPAPAAQFAIRMSMKKAKSFFLDRDAVTRMIDKKNRRALGAIGGMTRTLARRSMRKSRKLRIGEFDPELRRLVNRSRSANGQFTAGVKDIRPWPTLGALPGQPPKFHNRRIRDQIFFVVSPTFDSVIIGPLVGESGGVTPEVLEYGGTGTAEVGTWVRIWQNGQPKIRLSAVRRKSVRYEARPFMRPAYDAALDKLVPGLWLG